MIPNNPTSPAHYLKRDGDLECIEAIRASMNDEAFAGYLKGNVQKYIWRYEQHTTLGRDIDCLRKANVYLGWLIKHETDLWTPTTIT